MGVNRAGNGIYFTQGSGQVNYTMTGGTMSEVGSGPGNGWLFLGFGAGSSGTLTVNGASALVQTPNLDLSYTSGGGSGTVYMTNGTFQTDSIYTNNPSTSSFYFQRRHYPAHRSAPSPQSPATASAKGVPAAFTTST